MTAVKGKNYARLVFLFAKQTIKTKCSKIKTAGRKENINKTDCHLRNGKTD